jgi:hypothetical protein
MSYVLSIFAPPGNELLPSEIFELSELVSRLHHQPAPPDSRFADLARQLTRRYKDPGKTEGDSVWTEGPMDGEAATAVYNVGIATAQIDWMVPFVVRHARKLGLAVLDEQDGAAYLPDGSVLRVPRQSDDQSPTPKTLDMRDLHPAQLAPGEPYWLHLSKFFNTYPITAEFALKRMDELRAKPVGSLEEYQELVRRLTRRYPDSRTSMNSDQRIWAEDPADVPAGWVYSLCIKPEHITAVRPFMIDAANAFGLDLLDPQAMQMFLRDSDVVWQKRVWTSRKRELTKTVIINSVVEALRPLFEAHGFKYIKSLTGFNRKIKDGKQEIRFSSPGGQYVNASINILFKDKSGICQTVYPNLPANAADPLWFWGNLPSFVNPDDFGELYMDRNSGIGVYQEQHFAPLIAGMEKVFEERVLPLIDDINDIDGLDALLNPPVPERPFYRRRSAKRLIVAYLAHNPGFDQMVVDVLHELRNYSWEAEGDRAQRSKTESLRPKDAAEDLDAVMRLAKYLNHPAAN